MQERYTSRMNEETRCPDVQSAYAIPQPETGTLGTHGQHQTKDLKFLGHLQRPPGAKVRTLGGRLKRSVRAVQLFGRLAVLETHTLRY